MSIVMGMDEISAEKVQHRPGKNGGPGTSNTPFFRATSDTPDAPTAFIARYEPGRFSSAHFHAVDQFQILVDGSGTFGRHDVAPFCVHFSRAYTQYGPLQADKSSGWAFMTLRTRYDPGAQRQPELGLVCNVGEIASCELLDSVQPIRQRVLVDEQLVSRHAEFPLVSKGTGQGREKLGGVGLVVLDDRPENAADHALEPREVGGQPMGEVVAGAEPDDVRAG